MDHFTENPLQELRVELLINFQQSAAERLHSISRWVSITNSYHVAPEEAPGTPIRYTLNTWTVRFRTGWAKTRLLVVRFISMMRAFACSASWKQALSLGHQKTEALTNFHHAIPSCRLFIWPSFQGELTTGHYMLRWHGVWVPKKVHEYIASLDWHMPAFRAPTPFPFCGTAFPLVCEKLKNLQAWFGLLRLSIYQAS